MKKIYFALLFLSSFSFLPAQAMKRARPPEDEIINDDSICPLEKVQKLIAVMSPGDRLQVMKQLFDTCMRGQRQAYVDDSIGCLGYYFIDGGSHFCDSTTTWACEI